MAPTTRYFNTAGHMLVICQGYTFTPTAPPPMTKRERFLAQMERGHLITGFQRVELARLRRERIALDL